MNNVSETSQPRQRLVEPQTLKGFQDFLPGGMIARNLVLDKIRRAYERYGFVPVDTPILEHLTTLVGTGGEDINKQLFRLDTPEREPAALRFDLTVPFARLVAQYPEDLRLPFRRYHIAPVFRADKPGPGRFRQFTQCDIDIAGSDSVFADAEIIAAMCGVLEELSLVKELDDGTRVPEYQVRVNNRRLVDALLEGNGMTATETQKHVLRVVDKLQKVGPDNIRKELGEGRVDESGDPIRGVGLESAVTDKILAFLSVTGDSRQEVASAVAETLPAGELAEAAVQDMRDLAAALDGLNVPEDAAVFDPSLARGLDYYTGPVYEAFLPGAPEFGSIMGGGRYDTLVERFLDTSIPATGASIGLDRLIAALDHLGKLDTPSTTVQVLVVAMKGMPMPALLAVASELRTAGIATEVYMGEGAGVGAQLSFANTNGIPIAVILGEDELNNGTISVKDLLAGQRSREEIEDREQYRKAGKSGQVTVDRGELTETVREILEFA